MYYYIITKLERVNNEIIKSDIGYVTNQVDADYINQTHSLDYYNWMMDNVIELDMGSKVLLDYFIITPYFYTQNKGTTVLPNLPLITDLNNPE